MWKLRFPALRAQAEVLQAAETRDRLAKNLIDLYIGEAEILPQSKRPKEERQNGEIAVRVCRPKACIDIPAHYVCVATGSRPNRPPKMRSGSRLPFMKGVVVDATEMGTITDLPNACAIIGGGVIAVEYANVLAGLGVGVSLLCKDEEFMPFLSEELRVELKQRMPRRLRVDLVLYSGGRDANTETLGCDAAGVDLARYGRVKVDGSFRTSNPRVYAIGDVTGPPGLASSAQMGGRAVATYLFNDKMQKLKQFMLETSTEMEDVVDDPFFAAEAESASGAQRTSEQLQQYEQTAMLGSDDSMADAAGGAEGESLFERVAGAPLTLWTIPEISSVGLTEEQAFAEGMRKASQGGSMVTGYAYFKDIARGRLSGGDAAGFLKLVARADGPTRHVVVGVQIIDSPRS
ncbi:soluble pyridine nucleotide transhydrogenase [Ectocarpus siliculosus]|uniref:Soluble pyridine nucleotide transhydrogenase n=1 Tax=Ectocarpus siliculosus TaxID=2880 RepID=D8LER9_ECTSI|nr:soluble pyridine nucleotide transhydrogenase [Ectocarpus siliculosus]|eukprot:CBN79739.1 soluble pyridine nucleotide transhydrogenase [Ectocarpus siliculosus]